MTSLPNSSTAKVSLGFRSSVALAAATDLVMVRDNDCALIVLGSDVVIWLATRDDSVRKQKEEMTTCSRGNK